MFLWLNVMWKKVLSCFPFNGSHFALLQILLKMGATKNRRCENWPNGNLAKNQNLVKLYLLSYKWSLYQYIGAE